MPSRWGDGDQRGPVDGKEAVVLAGRQRPPDGNGGTRVADNLFN